MTQTQMTQEKADHFVETWIAAWNRHDLDTIMSMCHDEVEFESGFLVSMFDVPSGKLHGKAELRRWFAKSVEGGTIHIDPPIHVLISIDTVCLVESIGGTIAANVFTLDEAGLITRSIVHG